MGGAETRDAQKGDIPCPRAGLSPGLAPTLALALTLTPTPTLVKTKNMP